MAIEYTLRYKYNKIHHFLIFQEMVDFLFCISQIADTYISLIQYKIKVSGALKCARGYIYVNDVLLLLLY